MLKKYLNEISPRCPVCVFVCVKYEHVKSYFRCVKGLMPKAGDRVLVEAQFNANLPFKWNATRIQVLPSQVNPYFFYLIALASCGLGSLSVNNISILSAFKVRILNLEGLLKKWLKSIGKSLKAL